MFNLRISQNVWVTQSTTYTNATSRKNLATYLNGKLDPLQESKTETRYILANSDYASIFVFTIPMEDQKTSSVATLHVESIITIYGAPEMNSTD